MIRAPRKVLITCTLCTVAIGLGFVLFAVSAQATGKKSAPQSPSPPQVDAPSASPEVRQFFDKFMYNFFEDWSDHSNPAIFIKAHAQEIAPLFIEAAKSGPTAEDLAKHGKVQLNKKDRSRFFGTYRSRALMGLGMAATPEAVKVLKEFAASSENSIRADAKYNLRRAGVTD